MEHTFSKALCDLGASINLMPFSMTKKLNLREITPTSLSLQMANRSLTFPKGIIEDVLHMEEDRAASIILGRPFLATRQALIYVKMGN